MTLRKLRLIFVGAMSLFAIGLTMLITSCRTIQPDWHTAKALAAYPNLTDIHQPAHAMDIVQGYDDIDKVTFHVKEDKIIELYRVAKAPMSIDAAEAGQLADIGTTAIGLAQGFAETNPLGIVALPLKYVVNEYAEDSPDCREIKPLISGFGWGASFANIATIAGAGMGAIPVGLIVGVVAYQHLPGTDGCEWMGSRVKL